MPNIAKPKGAKDEKNNVSFTSYVHGLFVSIDTPGKSTNISAAEFEAKYDIVSEDGESKGS